MGARANSATSAKMQFARRKAWKSVWSVTSQPSSCTLAARGGVGVRTRGLLLIVTVGGRDVAGGDDDRAET